MNATVALSIREPWAWLIIRPDITDPAARAALRGTGLMKDVENRTWPTRFRGWVMIQTSKTIDKEGLALVRHEFPEIPLPELHAFVTGHVIGEALVTDCVQSCASRWFGGPYGFLIGDSWPVDPFPVRGMQGFFTPGQRYAGSPEESFSEARTAGQKQLF